MSFGNGGGNGSISGSSDVTLSSPAAGDIFTYDSSSKWENGAHLRDVKGVCVYNGSAYPSRPNGYGSVEWIGPVDPGSAAQNNDTWVNTA